MRCRAGIVLLALISCATLLAACQGAPSDGADEQRPRPAPADRGSLVPESPLPIERYLLDHDRRSRLLRARNTLVKSCMRQDGVRPVRLGGGTGPRRHSERRYGLADMATAVRRGYHPGTPGEERSGQGDRPRRLTERQQRALSDCSERALDKLGGPLREHDVAARIDVRSVVRAQRDPEVRRVFRRWSSCMRDRGFHYAGPWDPPNDRRFTGPDVTDTEHAVARADVDCKRRTDLVAIWHRADADRQTEMIAEHRAELERTDRAIRGQLRVAERILHENG